MRVHTVVKRRMLGLLLAITASLASAAGARAAELLMLEQQGCAWCQRWDREIGSVYPKTAEARRAPLRRVDIKAPWPEDLKNIATDRYTPTFVLVEDGIEIGRVRGYTGDQFFWFLLNEMLDKLPQGAPTAG